MKKKQKIPYIILRATVAAIIGAALFAIIETEKQLRLAFRQMKGTQL